jgi:Icc-related predicted phosphoesterase
MARAPLRIAAMGDIHCRRDDSARLRELVKQLNAEADLLLLCGDLTDRGLIEEARVLADALAALRIPCAAVLGNHDWDAGLSGEVSARLCSAGVIVLDGEHVVLEGVGIAGVKGFGGGFEQRTLQAFGEPLVKAFVQEGVNEALKLEAALGQLDTTRKIVLLHYAPIAKTTEGEQPEIVAYLGTSRLAGPIDAYGADVIFHGHAHHGSPEGQTAKGIRVYNVAAPLLRKTLGHSFRVIELNVEA